MQTFIHSLPTPHLNLAYEEWLFEHFKDELLRIWINPPCIVVGKHQNAIAEANVNHCIKADLPVLRRISGGGTVYHDYGNINFSFFKKVDKEKMIDYDRNLNLIKAALNRCGYPVSMNARHDLFLNDSKVSGNAQHLRKGKALHHGTILYDANLTQASKALKRTSGTIVDKSVQSVRSTITNLKTVKNTGNSKAFLDLIVEQLSQLGIEYCDAPIANQIDLEKKVVERYNQESWNYGYSPRYTFENETKIGHIKIQVDRGGCIMKAELFFKTDWVPFRAIDIEGLFHHPEELREWLRHSRNLTNQQIEACCGLLF